MSEHETELSAVTLLAARLSHHVLQILADAGPAFWEEVAESSTLQRKIEDSIHEDLKRWKREHISEI